MVRVYAPALSLDASGTIGNAMVFSKWKGRNYVRERVVPANPKSGPQVGVRAMFKFLAQIWDGLTTVNKATWEDRGDQLVASPFNGFVSYNQKRWRNFLGITKEDPAIDTAFSGTMGALSCTGGVRQVTVTQAVTAAGNGWGLAIFRSPTGTFDTAFSNCIAVLPFDGTNDIVYVDTPLAPATYYYDTRPLTDDGVLDAEVGEQSGAAT